ncbi:hypothetical protein FACS189429_3830 [Bacteroidia bacterium]|nr:hypothetical protein FACS189429_3830 [Bacteroidia bacterium]
MQKYTIMNGKINFNFNYAMSNAAILKQWGAQIKQMRLNKNLTQKQIAINAGMSRTAIIDLENSGKGTMSSLVQVLRALEKLEILNHFITEAPVSPIQIAKLHGKQRQRASRVPKIRQMTPKPYHFVEPALSVAADSLVEYQTVKPYKSEW